MPPSASGTAGYRDVSELFIEAARDMAEGEVILADNFTLHEAMSGFEIGEPRLDSGMSVPGEEPRPPFDPIALMLPKELCWLIDRSFACEIEWHAGNPLSQTVFTMLHVHHLAAINPEYIPAGKISNQDSNRPPELVTLVLRAAIFGLLKSCDLGWRILAQDRTYDGEDWQSEKCDVSMMEGVKVALALNKLDQAIKWVTTYVLPPWSEALSSRLLLRKTLLEILDADIYSNPTHISSLIITARLHLSRVRSNPCPEPDPASPAYLAIDPYIARTLISFIPLRKLDLPSSPYVWDTLQSLLDAWDELLALSRTHNLATWEIVCNLRAWSPHLTLRTAMVRTLAQTIFHRNNLVLNAFPISWVADQFALHALGCSWSTIVKTIRRHGSISDANLREFETELSDLILDQIRIAWFNPPRRRRQLVNFLPRWLNILILATHSTMGISTRVNPEAELVSRISHAIQSWRLSTVREVVLSGFQLELYSPSERAFAYWYTSIVIDAHLTSLDEILKVISRDSPAYATVQHDHIFMTALQAMAIPLFAISTKLQNMSWDRQRSNFMRRFKWSFEWDTDNDPRISIVAPDFYRFISACGFIVRADLSPTDSVRFARDLLNSLIALPNPSIGRWNRDRNKFLSTLVETCTNLLQLPDTMGAIESFDTSRLVWDPAVDPWFPRLMSL